MANEEQLKILQQGVEVWNKWRKENPDEHIDLSEANLHGASLSEAKLGGAYLNRANINDADLSRADLSGAILAGAELGAADLSGANLSSADFQEAYLSSADLSGAILIKAKLIQTDLIKARLIQADLSAANLNRANLSEANLSGADLSRAELGGASLVETNLEGSTLTGCHIYGISAWKLKLKDAKQNDLDIAPYDEPAITVDNLQVAQFIYLLLHNEEIRQVMDTITSKVVLILGRFTSERKTVLDAIKEELRRRGYLPILFDFEKPASRDLTETISTLAHMARFVIADITEAKSIPAELERIVPDLPSVPIMPLILNSEYEYALFEHVRRYHWVLEPYRYVDQGQLLATLEEKVIAPAEEKVEEIRTSGR